MAIKPGSIQVAIRQSPDQLKATYVQASNRRSSMSDERPARSVLLVGGGHHTNTEREEQVPFPEQWLYT
jgi:hypothetical protein